MQQCKSIIRELKANANPASLPEMARYGINPENALGVRIGCLQAIARRTGRDHDLAQALWDTGIREARILAAYVAEPDRVTKSMMNRWARDFDSWDVCDQVCANLFDRTPFAPQKAVEWSARRHTFVKRAGFVLMATLAVHDKSAADNDFLAYLPIVAREAGDDRNYVKKAVNWALRQIGKRNRRLHAAALETAAEIEAQDTRSARWIARDAIRELTAPRTLKRIPA
jgi:3-methyladenine DNA glycosylase AlkD